MLNDLDSTARKLAEYMSKLSHKAYFAMWMQNLEYDLWRTITETAGGSSFPTIKEVDIQRLRSLSDACGGWIIFDPEKMETFVSLTQWKIMYSENRNSKNANTSPPS